MLVDDGFELRRITANQLEQNLKMHFAKRPAAVLLFAPARSQSLAEHDARHLGVEIVGERAEILGLSRASVLQGIGQKREAFRHGNGDFFRNGLCRLERPSLLAIIGRVLVTHDDRPGSLFEKAEMEPQYVPLEPGRPEQTAQQRAASTVTVARLESRDQKLSRRNRLPFPSLRERQQKLSGLRLKRFAEAEQFLRTANDLFDPDSPVVNAPEDFRHRVAVPRRVEQFP